MFKFDTHIHTSETSHCGIIPAKETVDLYKKAGYDGICITDHYYKSYFENMGDISWAEKINIYLKGYKNACIEGEKANLNIFLGIEITFAGSPNDYLVFGVTEEFLLENMELYNYNMSDFRELTKNYGMLIYQAHPFRPYITPQMPVFLDGIEVYNGNKRHNSRNELAYEYALDNNLKMSSGSDCHQLEDVGRGGIITLHAIKTNQEFVETLKSEKIELIRSN